MSHTPGPWEIDPRVSTRVRDAADTTIASAGMASRNLEEAQANARLIATVLELLGALRAAVADCRCSLRERESGHRTECFAIAAKEVIAKATGGAR